MLTTLSSQMSISMALGNLLPAANGLRKWRSSTGHVYNRPKALPQPKQNKTQESKESTPLLDSQSQKPNGTAAASVAASVPPQSEELALQRGAEEAFWIHYNHGGDFIDDNPITGRPGDFHLTSTGRKPVPPLQQIKKAGLGGLGGGGPPSIDTTVGGEKGGGKGKEKTPKSATAPGKLKRRKSTKLASNTSTPKAS